MSVSNSTETVPSNARSMPVLKLIVLSGRSGSGKSSTAYEICHILRVQKIPHVHIDGDNLDAFYPRDDNSEMMLQNLAAMWNVYLPVVNRTWEKTDDTKLFVIILSGTAMVLNLKEIVGVFSRVLEEYGTSQQAANTVAFQVYPIVLEADDTVVEGRLAAREIGGELEAHLQSSSRMSLVLGETNSEQIQRFRTDGLSVTDLAVKILRTVNFAVA